MWIKYKWENKIINIETAFLYRSLEEEIYLKIPNVRKNTPARKSTKMTAQF